MKNNYYAKTLAYWEIRAEGYARENKPKITSEVIKSLQEKQVRHVLDIGCGPGYNAIDILNCIDCEITCLDFSSKMIHLARSNIKEAGFFKKVDFLEGNISDIELGNTFCDTAVAISAFHYLLAKDIRRACQNIYNALEPNGMLLIVEYWTKEKLSKFEKKALDIVNKARKFQNNFKAVFLKDQEYFDILKQNGFTKIEKKYLAELIYLDKYGKMNTEIKNEIVKLQLNSDNSIDATVIKAQKQ